MAIVRARGTPLLYGEEGQTVGGVVCGKYGFPMILGGFFRWIYLALATLALDKSTPWGRPSPTHAYPRAKGTPPRDPRSISLGGHSPVRGLPRAAGSARQYREAHCFTVTAGSPAAGVCEEIL